MSILRKRIWEAAPDSVKDFPLKRAEDVVLQQLLLLGQKTVKGSLITLFILSSISDVIFCISRNKDLMIPVGLFVGCMMADFLKEASRELFPDSEVYFLFVFHTSFSHLTSSSDDLLLIFCLTENRFEAAPFGHWLLVCVCEVHFHIFYFTRTSVSFACCQWWIGANSMAVERFTGGKRWTKWIEFLSRPREFHYRSKQLDMRCPCT